MQRPNLTNEHLPKPCNDILYRFLKREEKALKEVYDLFYGQLCYFTEKLIANRQAAEEIVVDAFVKTFQSKVGFTSMDHLRGYLFEVVKNQSLNHLEKERRHEKHFQDYLDVIQFNTAHFENEIVETTALELIFQIAESLPVECKRIFDLIYKEQMSYQDIAAQLQLKIQTVRNQNARAIAHIRNKLQYLP